MKGPYDIEGCPSSPNVEGNEYKRIKYFYIVIASDPALAGERGNLVLQIRDCFVISCLPQAGIPRNDNLLNALALKEETVNKDGKQPAYEKDVRKAHLPINSKEGRCGH